MINQIMAVAIAAKTLTWTLSLTLFNFDWHPTVSLNLAGIGAISLAILLSKVKR